MILESRRLVLRPWRAADAESLFQYASDPAVGPAAGWPPHQNLEESRSVIANVLSAAECYAICEAGSDTAIGAVELQLFGHSDKAKAADECELGCWLGRPFWGRGYMPEAAERLIRRAFEELGCRKIWAGYFEGNEQSKRMQEKLGFVYDHTEKDHPVPLLDTVRTLHVNVLTPELFAGRGADRTEF